MICANRFLGLLGLAGTLLLGRPCLSLGQATETVLYSFGNGPTDGLAPIGGLLFDSAGNIYGTTTSGGQYCQDNGGCGTVYELVPSAGGWSETVLYSFCITGNSETCPDGAYPQAGLVSDAAGDLYGTTQVGGAGFGTVFELTPPSIPGAAWIETVLWAFSGPKHGDGANPFQGKLNWDKAGNLYGTTVAGGTHNRGAVFELSPKLGGGWNETVLHSFDGDDGDGPLFGVAIDSSGNLYGTTNVGGIVNNLSFCESGCGLVYELTPSNDTWTETVLYRFNGKSGARPYSAISIDQSGNLYATFEYGGTLGECGDDGCGGVLKLSPNGMGGGARYSFLFDGQNGANPMSGVLVDSMTKTVFGTTWWGNDVYMIQGKKETVVYQFCSQVYCTDGDSPVGGILVSRGGQLYGVTSSGGANNEGVVFSISRPSPIN
jgi:uncharacterized repeat protein (TIGR03803 family)